MRPGRHVCLHVCVALPQSFVVPLHMDTSLTKMSNKRQTKKKSWGIFSADKTPASHSRSATETSIDFDLLTY